MKEGNQPDLAEAKAEENRARIIVLEERGSAITRELAMIREIQSEDHQAIIEIRNTVTLNKGFWAGVLIAVGAFWAMIMAVVMVVKDKLLG